MGRDHAARSFGIDVPDAHLVLPGFGQQAGDQCPDLAGTQNQNLVHHLFPCLRPTAGRRQVPRLRRRGPNGPKNGDSERNRALHTHPRYFAVQRSALALAAVFLEKPSMPTERTPDRWSPTSWKARPAEQHAVYRDPHAVERMVEEIARLPPIVVSWEVESLRREIAEAQQGKRFLLQGGDCAETFDDCESGQIAQKLKILLQNRPLLHPGT